MKKYWNLLHYYVVKFYEKINFFKFDIPEARAGGLMGVLIILIECTFLNCVQSIYRKNVWDYIFSSSLSVLSFGFITVISSILINHFVLFRDNKYKEYFKEFEKIEKSERKKLGWISFFIVLGIFILFGGSFLLL